MNTRLKFEIQRQPDDFTCGPTCLHALYRYYGGKHSLEDVIARTEKLEDGGTLGVLLACDALRQGYEAKIFTYNLQVFDPTWFASDAIDVRAKIEARRDLRKEKKLKAACQAYLNFLDLGGELRFEDLKTSLIRRYLNRNQPILTGLSATYLYRTAREWGPKFDPDDVQGSPAGHFVVLCGYDKEEREVLVADPLIPNPVSKTHIYPVDIDRVICSILLGIVTYDANLVIISPKGGR